MPVKWLGMRTTCIYAVLYLSVQTRAKVFFFGGLGTECSAIAREKKKLKTSCETHLNAVHITYKINRSER